MTLSVPRRLNDIELADVARRLASPMNDDGLRTWYRQDGNALLEEVIALRRERAAAMHEFATHPPLEGIDPSADLREVADRLTEIWVEQQEGVWQRAEVKRIRDKLAVTKSDLTSVSEDRDQQAVRISQLKDELEHVQAQLADAIVDGRRAVADIEAMYERIRVWARKQLEEVSIGLDPNK